MVQRWEVGDQPIAIGRDGTADVTIDDAALSRRHFMIWREGDHYLIKDLDSQNGTWVDVPLQRKHRCNRPHSQRSAAHF
jgi:pSer/pThr/pTyr-binding forkhead associated (FHA) protein